MGNTENGLPHGFVVTDEMVRRAQADGNVEVTISDPVPKPASKSKDNKKKFFGKKTSDVPRSAVRGIPTRLLQHIRAEFMTATNHEDALVAFICTRCPEMMADREVQAALSPTQIALIDNKQDSEYAVLSDRVRSVMSKVDKLSRSQQEMLMLLCFMCIERLDMRDAQAMTETINKRDVEPMLSFLKDVSPVFDEFKNLKDYRDGKPYDF